MRIRRIVLRRHFPRLLVLIFIIWNTLEVLHISSLLSQPPQRVDTVPRHSKHIYIASLHWNNEAILRSHWNNAVVELARTFGADNVFVSVYESGSWDNTKGALRDLDRELQKLGVRRNITLSDVTHRDEIAASRPAGPGWIDTPRGKKELRRIPYLSRLRDLTLKPLEELAARGERFDKILFLNDVVFSTSDVLRLLNTNGGDYAAACSLDFSKPPLYYDTFALRDSEGHEHVMQTWPYFRARQSRHAMKANQPVPVRSCWNGMVSMPIEPFLSSPPLRFRGVPDSLALHHVEGSECCLIHADNPLSYQKPIFLNPDVRVGYNPAAYAAEHPENGVFMSSWRIFTSLWENRLRRWFTSPWLKEWAVSRRVRRWKAEEKGNREPGVFCLINEMQVLVENGWAHV